MHAPITETAETNLESCRPALTPRGMAVVLIIRATRRWPEIPADERAAALDSLKWEVELHAPLTDEWVAPMLADLAATVAS